MTILAKTIMLTTVCYAGCNHCPFSSPEMLPKHLSLGHVKRILQNSPERMIVLSGGEPFEYPHIEELLMEKSGSDKQLRIATGGHKNLSPYLELLKSIPNLDGISLGTDVMSTRCSDMDLKNIWKNNVALLNSEKIPYSLTFTAKSDLELISSLMKNIEPLHLFPQFIYLRSPSGDLRDDIQSEINRLFPHVQVIWDELF